MIEQNNLEKVKEVFATACQALDNQNVHYRKEEEENRLLCGVQLEEAKLDISLQVDAQRQLVIQIAYLPIMVSEDKRVDVALAVNGVNNSLVDGNFDFDLASGNLFFRVTNGFMGSTLGEDIFFYMLGYACHVVNLYFDKFLCLASGIFTLEQFFEAE